MSRRREYDTQAAIYARFEEECHQKELDDEISDYNYLREEISKLLGEQDTEAYYNNIEEEARAEEYGRLEGQMDFLETYMDGDAEKYRLAKLLLGITE